MIAAAGCGKTEVIAAAVSQRVGKRELILTHTHAGVDAIRARLTKFGVEKCYYEVQTIAGWALGLARAFPRTSELTDSLPRNNSDYFKIYLGATKLLGISAVQGVLQASYSGVYVDEYQDCTVQQHVLVLALRDFLPCRVLGDPLQGIFDFGDNETVRWEDHVRPSFDEVAGPSAPWRWATNNPRLGTWLQDARTRLQNGQELDLSSAPVTWIDGSNSSSRQELQVNACLRAASHAEESVIAIHQWPNQCHEIASRLKGRFSCIEPIDLKVLYEFAVRLEKSAGFGRGIAVVDFAGKCMTKVKTELKTIRSALEKESYPSIRKHVACLEALRAVCENDSLKHIGHALRVISDLSGSVIYRRELLREMLRSIKSVLHGETKTLEEAAWTIRNQTSQRGRPIQRCSVGTTLLVKGLEFDHAVILDADVYDRQNLYVALTRGRKSLTIVSRSMTILPIESKR